jgi:hypothetical protein
MPSKRDRRIHPSVTNQPPRQTARTGRREAEIFDDGLSGGGVRLL